MTEQEFVQFVKKECKYYGVKCRIGKGVYVKFTDGERSSGYFDDGKLELAVGGKNPNFLSILAHEYCHMRQWVEKADVWVKTNEEKSYIYWAKHLKGEKVENMDYHYDLMRDLELDNEKRTVQLIKDLNLPIDVRGYTKKANAYVMFYNYMKISGKWCRIPPYTCERLMAELPDTFSMNYSKLSKKLETIFREENI